MTLEDMLNDYASKGQAVADATGLLLRAERERNILRSEIVPLIADAPGGKVYHKPSGIVYGVTRNGNLAVIEAIYSSDEIPSANDEDIELVQCCQAVA